MPIKKISTGEYGHIQAVKATRPERQALIQQAGRPRTLLWFSWDSRQALMDFAQGAANEIGADVGRSNDNDKQGGQHPAIRQTHHIRQG